MGELMFETTNLILLIGFAVTCCLLFAITALLQEISDSLKTLRGTTGIVNEINERIKQKIRLEHEYY